MQKGGLFLGVVVFFGFASSVPHHRGDGEIHFDGIGIGEEGVLEVLEFIPSLVVLGDFGFEFFEEFAGTGGAVVFDEGEGEVVGGSEFVGWCDLDGFFEDVDGFFGFEGVVLSKKDEAQVAPRTGIVGCEVGGFSEGGFGAVEEVEDFVEVAEVVVGLPVVGVEGEDLFGGGFGLFEILCEDVEVGEVEPSLGVGGELLCDLFEVLDGVGDLVGADAEDSGFFEEGRVFATLVHAGVEDMESHLGVFVSEQDIGERGVDIEVFGCDLHGLVEGSDGLFVHAVEGERGAESVEGSVVLGVDLGGAQQEGDGLIIVFQKSE